MFCLKHVAVTFCMFLSAANAVYFGQWSNFIPSSTAPTRERTRECIAAQFSSCQSMAANYFKERYENCPATCGSFNHTNAQETACIGTCDQSEITLTLPCNTDSSCMQIRHWYCLDIATCTGSWTPWSSTSCSAFCDGGNQTRTRECLDFTGNPTLLCPGTGNSTTQSETLSCNSFACPVYGTWSTYSSCSLTCGTGAQTRMRTCYDADGIHPTGIGCGANNLINETDSLPCNAQACPAYRAWNEGTCSHTCGSGSRTRSRSCFYQSVLSSLCPGANALGVQEETVSCNLGACAEWTAWANSTCSSSCGAGNLTRTRVCFLAGLGPVDTCPGANGNVIQSVVESCMIQDCPAYGPWTPVGFCSATCEGGTLNFVRQCLLNGATAIGCSGPSTMQETCNTQNCSCLPWVDLTPCSQQCDGGTFVRSQNCSGTVTNETVACNTELCTCDAWAPQGSCSALCDGGTITETRLCNRPNGTTQTETRQETCNSQSCGCNSFVYVSECTQPCDNGTRIQEWSCVNATDEYKVNQTVSCNEQSCGCGSWADNGTCSLTCGGGTVTQERTCGINGTNTRVVACNEQACPVCGSWTESSNCTEACNGGTLLQTRLCNASNGDVIMENRTIACNTEPCVAIGGGTFTWLIILATLFGSALVAALIYFLVPFLCCCCFVAGGERRVTAVAALVIHSIQVGSLGMIQWRGKTRLRTNKGKACAVCCPCCCGGDRQSEDGNSIPLVRIFGKSSPSDADAEEGNNQSNNADENGLRTSADGEMDATLHDLTAWASQMMNDSQNIKETEVYDLSNRTNNNSWQVNDGSAYAWVHSRSFSGQRPLSTFQNLARRFSSRSIDHGYAEMK